MIWAISVSSSTDVQVRSGILDDLHEALGSALTLLLDEVMRLHSSRSGSIAVSAMARNRREQAAGAR